MGLNKEKSSPSSSMKVHFKGTRGSIPTSYSADEISKKIVDALLIARGKDLRSEGQIIDFVKTSETNNSFIQMFEVSQDEGAAKFTKLAIRDLGVIKKSVLDRESGELENEVLASNKNLVANPDFKEILSKSGEGDRYMHVFVFGKIIDRTEVSPDPGTAIYFTPIFSLELEIE